MSNICVFLAQGFEEIEALTVVDIIRRTDLTVVTVSISDSKRVVGAHNIAVEADYLFDEVDYSEIDMIVLPGGMPGTLNLYAHEELKKLILKFNDEGKKIAAICAAPLILGRLGILSGKKATCYPGFEDELVDAFVAKTPVVQEGNIITGIGMGVAIDFSLQLVKMYKNTEFIQQLQEKIQFNIY